MDLKHHLSTLYDSISENIAFNYTGKKKTLVHYQFLCMINWKTDLLVEVVFYTTASQGLAPDLSVLFIANCDCTL